MSVNLLRDTFSTDETNDEMNAFAGRHNELTTISLSNVLFYIEKKTLCIWRERNAMALYGAVRGRCMAAQFGTPTGAIGCKIKQTHTYVIRRETQSIFIAKHSSPLQSLRSSTPIHHCADPSLDGVPNTAFALSLAALTSRLAAYLCVILRG